MRPFAITDKKILKEQQELADQYMAEAPEDTGLYEYIFANCSEYFIQFYEKRHSKRDFKDSK